MSNRTHNNNNNGSKNNEGRWRRTFKHLRKTRPLVRAPADWFLLRTACLDQAGHGDWAGGERGNGGVERGDEISGVRSEGGLDIMTE